MYHPLPVAIPHVLAPASPASTSAIPSTLRVEAATKRLAALDAPRRRLGLSYAVPPRLGLPQLICTGVNGIWSTSGNLDEEFSGAAQPPWARAEQGRPLEPDDDSDDPYRTGLPRNEAEAEEWAARSWQERQTGRVVAKVKRTAIDRAGSAIAPVPFDASELTAQAGTTRTRGHAGTGAPKLVTSHFTSSKAAVSGAVSTKKRPAGSPPPSGATAGTSHLGGPRSSVAANRASKRSPSPMREDRAATGHSSNRLTGKTDSRRTHKGSLPATELVLETETPEPFMAEEVLFERGCTQVSLA